MPLSLFTFTYIRTCIVVIAFEKPPNAFEWQIELSHINNNVEIVRECDLSDNTQHDVERVYLLAQNRIFSSSPFSLWIYFALILLKFRLFFVSPIFCCA